MHETNHLPPGRLAAYFDGELPFDEREDVARHIAVCPACRAALDAMGTTRIALHALPAEPLPAGLWPRVAEALPDRPVVHRYRRMAVAAVMLAGMLALGWFLAARAGGPAAQRPLLAAAAPFDWGLFLSDLDHPTTTPRFPGAYRLEAVALDEALDAAGVQGDFRAEALPATLRLDAAHVVDNGTARAAQLVYRGEGGPLFVFCQRRSLPVAFSGFRAEPATLGRTPCYSVYCSRYRALSVSTRRGTYTLVGRRGDPMLAAALEALAGS